VPFLCSRDLWPLLSRLHRSRLGLGLSRLGLGLSCLGFGLSRLLPRRLGFVGGFACAAVSLSTVRCSWSIPVFPSALICASLVPGVWQNYSRPGS